jgi:hypothetical protein
MYLTKVTSFFRVAYTFFHLCILPHTMNIDKVREGHHSSFPWHFRIYANIHIQGLCYFCIRWVLIVLFCCELVTYCCLTDNTEFSGLKHILYVCICYCGLKTHFFTISLFWELGHSLGGFLALESLKVAVKS